MNGRSDSKVCCIGFPKTGTSSLSKALEMLGSGAVMCRFIYGPVGADEDPERYARIYDAHNREVKEYFEATSPDQLLVLRMGEGNEWKKLCSFLGHRVPRRLVTRRPLPFPRTNSQAQRRFHRRHKWINRTRGRAKRWIRRLLGASSLSETVVVAEVPGKCCRSASKMESHSSATHRTDVLAWR